MRVLVTGAAGFIGSHLVDRLLGSEHTVVGLDDLSTGDPENLAHLAGRGDFVLHVGDAREPTVVDPLMADTDAVVHLAAAVGVRLIVERPVRTIETNVRATEVVLAAAARHGTKTLLASTSEVYGKSNRPRFAEDDDVWLGSTTRSRWSYACSKGLGEWLALAHHAESGLPVVVARLFNTVGPRQSDRHGMVLPTFVAQARAGRPLTVYGDGRQVRCFAHVRDTVEALARLLDRDAAVGEVVNVGNDEEVTIIELAELVRERSGSASPIALVPYAEAFGPGFEDMQRRVPDLRKLERLTGFRPRTSLAEIVRSVLEDPSG